MIGNLVVLIVLALFVALFAWVAWHSWHARRGIVKWAGTILDVLLTLFLLLVTLVMAKGFFTFYLPAGTPPQALKVEGTPDQIARGKHITSFFCVQCHGHDDQPPLSGGEDLAANIPFPIGSIVPVAEGCLDLHSLMRTAKVINGYQTALEVILGTIEASAD